MFKSVMAVTPMLYFVVIYNPIIQSVRVQSSRMLTNETTVTPSFSFEFF